MIVQKWLLNNFINAKNMEFKNKFHTICSNNCYDGPYYACKNKNRNLVNLILLYEHVIDDLNTILLGECCINNCK